MDRYRKIWINYGQIWINMRTEVKHMEKVSKNRRTLNTWEILAKTWRKMGNKQEELGEIWGNTEKTWGRIWKSGKNRWTCMGTLGFRQQKHGEHDQKWVSRAQIGGFRVQIVENSEIIELRGRFNSKHWVRSAKTLTYKQCGVAVVQEFPAGEHVQGWITNDQC